MNSSMPVWEIVAMSVVVVAFFEVVGGIFEVMVGRCEVKWGIRVRPELSPFSCPPNRLEHLVPVNIPGNRHPFHLQLHLH